MGRIEAPLFAPDVRTTFEEVTFDSNPLFYARLPLEEQADPAFREYFGVPRQAYSPTEFEEFKADIATAIDWRDFAMAHAIYNEFFHPVYMRMLVGEKNPLVEISFQRPENPLFIKAVIDAEANSMEISVPLPIGNAPFFFLTYFRGALAAVNTGEELAEQPFDFETPSPTESLLGEFNQLKLDQQITMGLMRQSTASATGFIDKASTVTFFEPKSSSERTRFSAVFVSGQPYTPFPGELYVFHHEKLLNRGGFTVKRSSGDTKTISYPLIIDTKYISSIMDPYSLDWFKFPWRQISYDYRTHTQD